MEILLLLWRVFSFCYACTDRVSFQVSLSELHLWLSQSECLWLQEVGERGLYKGGLAESLSAGKISSFVCRQIIYIIGARRFSSHYLCRVHLLCSQNLTWLEGFILYHQRRFSVPQVCRLWWGQAVGFYVYRNPLFRLNSGLGVTEFVESLAARHDSS